LFLRKHREAKGLSQEALAAAAELHELTSGCSNEGNVARAWTLPNAIAWALGVPLSRL